jgi:hypothetical protein
MNATRPSAEQRSLADTTKEGIMSTDTPLDTFIVTEATITVALSDNWSRAHINGLVRDLYDRRASVGRVEVDFSQRTLCIHRSRQLTLKREREFFVSDLRKFLSRRHLVEKELATANR